MGGVLPANFLEEVIEIVAFSGEDSACPHVICFVATVAEAFTVDELAYAHDHDSNVVPFGSISCAFPSKVALPVFAFLC